MVAVEVAVASFAGVVGVVAASFVGVVGVVAASFVGVAEVVGEEVVDAELLAEALGQVAAHHQAVYVLERRA